MASQIAALIAQFDARHAAYARASGEASWATARQLVRVTQQATTAYDDWRAREEHMAENIGWLARQPDAGGPMLIDAHVTHIAAVGTTALPSMGQVLRRDWSSRYVTVAFAFGKGSFLALDRTAGAEGARAHRVIPFTVGPAPVETLDGVLGTAKEPVFLVDLRASPQSPIGEVDRWLRAPQRMHTVRGYFDGEHAFEAVAAAKAFDALLYVNTISPIHPLSARDASRASP